MFYFSTNLKLIQTLSRTYGTLHLSATLFKSNYRQTYKFEHPEIGSGYSSGAGATPGSRLVFCHCPIVELNLSCNVSTRPLAFLPTSRSAKGDKFCAL